MLPLLSDCGNKVGLELRFRIMAQNVRPTQCISGLTPACTSREPRICGGAYWDKCMYRHACWRLNGRLLKSLPLTEEVAMTKSHPTTRNEQKRADSIVSSRLIWFHGPHETAIVTELLLNYAAPLKGLVVSLAGRHYKFMSTDILTRYLPKSSWKEPRVIPNPPRKPACRCKQDVK